MERCYGSVSDTRVPLEAVCVCVCVCGGEEEVYVGVGTGRRE